MIRHQARIFKRGRESPRDATSATEKEAMPSSSIICQQSVLHPLAGEGIKAFGWQPGDMSKLQAMFRRAFYPQLNTMSTWNGNVDLTQIDAMLSIAVFNEDAAEFKKGIARLRTRIPAYFYLKSDGALPRGIAGDRGNVAEFWSYPSLWVDGLTQETCRDVGHHSQFGLGTAIHAMETAWHQGVDIYAENTERITAALELMAGFFLDGSMHGVCGGANTPTADRYDCWEIGYNHYHNRRGIPLPNTWRLITQQVRRVMIRDARAWNLIYQTLTHANVSQPSNPSLGPSNLPSRIPTGNPTKYPTIAPSVVPSSVPSTSLLSISPSSAPTTRIPSSAPTYLRTMLPTSKKCPSAMPSSKPSTNLPSIAATSKAPSLAPTNLRTVLPSIALSSPTPTFRLPSTPPSSAAASITPSSAPTNLRIVPPSKRPWTSRVPSIHRSDTPTNTRSTNPSAAATVQLLSHIQSPAHTSNQTLTTTMSSTKAPSSIYPTIRPTKSRSPGPTTILTPTPKKVTFPQPDS